MSSHKIPYVRIPKKCTIQVGDIAQVGAIRRDSTQDGSVKVRILKTTVHPQYNPLTHEYDFQLLRLGGWVSNKMTAPLNNNSTSPDNDQRWRGTGGGGGGAELVLVGMGRTTEDGPISDVLMKTTINRLVDSSDCQDAYPEFLVNGTLVICATGDGSSMGRDRYVNAL